MAPPPDRLTETPVAPAIGHAKTAETYREIALTFPGHAIGGLAHEFFS